MLRILHVGNGNEKHNGLRYYDVGRKLQHGLIRNKHNALFFSDRDIARTSGVLGSRLGGKTACNARLLKVARQFCPHMILLGHADIITNQTLIKLRHMLPDTRIAQFNVDPLFRSENMAAIKARIPYMDMSFITTGGSILQTLATPKHRLAFIPNPVDPAIEVHRCHEKTHTEHDVFYAVRATTTTGSQEENDRLTMPRYIRDAVPSMRPSFHGFDGTPELFGRPFYRAISKCAIGLNLSHKQTTKGTTHVATPEERYLYSSDRIAQYMGCGLLTFCERGFGLEEMFREHEAVFFENREELAEKIWYYCGHSRERMNIAFNGWHKVHRNHNATLIAQFMVDATMQWNYSYPYMWDNRIYREE